MEIFGFVPVRADSMMDTVKNPVVEAFPLPSQNNQRNCKKLYAILYLYM